MVVEPITHIEMDENGAAWMTGTNTKVIEVAIEHFAYGWDAEEIHLAHPHLPPGKIHAALSYYHDHKDQLDSVMQRQLDEYRGLRNQSTNQLARSQLLHRLGRQ